MSALIAEGPIVRPDRGPRARSRGRWVWPVGLVILGLCAAFLTAWSVWTGSRSDYYAAIALSMSRSWSNFFFGAMDPAATVTLDKIPGSYWIPALFVKAFGFSTWAVVLPNALAAVGASLLTAFTAKRLLSSTAGLLAGAIVATTPILVAVARSNQPETFFVLGLAAVGWAAAKALTRRSFGWLLVAGLFIALAFQTYMLESWALWPALAAGWLCTKQRWWRKLWTVAVAGAVSLVASLWWIAIVSLIPADARPFIGSTLSNSAWEMVFGYNGLGRFGDSTADNAAYRSFTPPFSGSPGVFRLFNEQLAGQVAWLLPTAFLAVIVLWVLRFSRPVTVLMTVWLATFTAMFSAVEGMHQFYTAALAIPMALTVGLAFAHARRRRIAWAQVSLIALAAATAMAIGVGYGGYSIPVAICQTVLALAAIAAIIGERRRTQRAFVAVLAGAAMLLTPLVWSAVSIANPSSVNPVAGGAADMSFGRAGAFAAPRQGAGGQAGSPGAPGGPRPSGPQAGARNAQSGEDTETAQLVTYLQQHQDGASYLAATFGAQSAAVFIIASDGGSFMPIGGFSGTDAAPTLERFQSLVADGQLRYVIAAGSRGVGGTPDAGDGTAAQILAWVKQTCTQPADAPGTSLYECASP